MSSSTALARMAVSRRWKEGTDHISASSNCLYATSWHLISNSLALLASINVYHLLRAQRAWGSGGLPPEYHISSIFLHLVIIILFYGGKPPNPQARCARWISSPRCMYITCFEGSEPRVMGACPRNITCFYANAFAYLHPVVPTYPANASPSLAQTML
jgi:hypothetical protein